MDQKASRHGCSERRSGHGRNRWQGPTFKAIRKCCTVLTAPLLASSIKLKVQTRQGEMPNSSPIQQRAEHLPHSWGLPKARLQAAPAGRAGGQCQHLFHSTPHARPRCSAPAGPGSDLHLLLIPLLCRYVVVDALVLPRQAPLSRARHMLPAAVFLLLAGAAQAGKDTTKTRQSLNSEKEPR